MHKAESRDAIASKTIDWRTVVDVYIFNGKWIKQRNTAKKHLLFKPHDKFWATFLENISVASLGQKNKIQKEYYNKIKHKTICLKLTACELLFNRTYNLSLITYFK